MSQQSILIFPHIAKKIVPFVKKTQIVLLCYPQVKHISRRIKYFRESEAEYSVYN